MISLQLQVTPKVPTHTKIFSGAFDQPTIKSPNEWEIGGGGYFVPSRLFVSVTLREGSQRLCKIHGI